MSEHVHAGASWGEYLSMTDVCLNPAACYPVYPTFTGTVPAEGRLVTLVGWVFRHEPSLEPTRMQAFRIREYVRCGTPDQVVEWRNLWLQRGVELLKSLGLPARSGRRLRSVLRQGRQDAGRPASSSSSSNSKCWCR